MNGAITMSHHYDLSYGSTNVYTVEPRHGLIPHCLHCGVGTDSVVLDSSAYFQYFQVGNLLIQDAFPNLTAAERDLLLIGIHPECAVPFYASMVEEEPDDDDAETLADLIAADQAFNDPADNVVRYDIPGEEVIVNGPGLGQWF